MKDVAMVVGDTWGVTMAKAADRQAKQEVLKRFAEMLDEQAEDGYIASDDHGRYQDHSGGPFKLPREYFPKEDLA
jgi:hypothetical protein